MSAGNVVALAGGVGGAKLALGLALALPPERLTVVVNVGDDFEHHGLYICPDLDTVMYTLAGLADPVKGWGIAGDTNAALQMLGRYGAETWFALGDQDLATHLVRTSALRAGARLTEVVGRMCRALGVAPRVLPVTDDRVATMVDTVGEGALSFQEYFVRRRWEPVVAGLRYEGAAAAALTPEVSAALDAAALVVFCPSNPVLSIDPMLAVDGLRARLAGVQARRVAVSPIVGGAALKGPAAKLMAEMGMEVSPVGVAAHYKDLLDGFVLDVRDAGLEPRVRALGMATLVTDTVMNARADRRRLAETILDWSKTL
ncbi:MAG: 2-phospho-L-lactate transferase [Anaerolineae bacterium]|nr:2-phospho-L-lactate transferase [Anaerolineae bacterium]